MGTEVALSFNALRAQLENEKSSLFKIDENIKKIVQTGGGRFMNDRFNPTAEYTRGGNRVGGRNSFPDGGNNYGKPDEHFGKRKQETKTVFSRLSARVQDSDGEEEPAGPGPAPVVKRVKMPSCVTRELPTRAAVLRAQGGDEQARTRNRRMFGSLLGTLQKFKQEEIVLQTKEEKKAQVERKIEEAARQEKERDQKQRKTLFAEREHKKATIKALEAKMARVSEFERWEASQKSLGNYILTKAVPRVYWLPKKMNDKADEKLTASRNYHEKYMTKKREELQEELQRIEQKVLRPSRPGLGAKENKRDSHFNDSHLNDSHLDNSHLDDFQNGGKKRDKFAMDVDKDESDDDHHEDEGKMGVDNGTRPVIVTEETELTPSKMETTETSNSSAMEVESDTTTEPQPPGTEDYVEPPSETEKPPSEPIEPSTEPAQPSNEPEQPSNEPEQPSNEPVQPLMEPVQLTDKHEDHS